MTARVQPGDPWEWGYIDMTYDNETFGMSQPMPRFQFHIELAKLVDGKRVGGRRVIKAIFVVLDPQPTVLLSDGKIH